MDASKEDNQNASVVSTIRNLSHKSVSRGEKFTAVLKTKAGRDVLILDTLKKRVSLQVNRIV